MLKLDPWNIVFTIVNLLILYWAMKKFLFGPVLAIMDKRRELIEGQLEDAAKKEQEATEMKAAYEKGLRQAKEEAKGIVEKAHGDAKVEYDRIIKEADERAAQIIVKANKTVELEKQKTLQEMESEIASLALVAAAKIMNESQENDQTLYNKFIKAGDANDTAGN